ncbi:MAG: excinuclease ABC subunit C [Candidatus Doudnabacteria bacterium RIFCSPLOWO2_02_FULL_49_13]|uniref:UvrABC system protein C n=1 Tax=Candidatus Doudnabacteria bacterium RIFCSPHIGHO2_12_FULL_48_16 TaxID=1817838 RepID=A0A1F5PK32_9BACT|nr:MAG: excinuclease ABC subunit C [Candidatus Doudnabacteria bacterium RIFCSPHIGHO2_02_FULL_49_24]OGE90227.1 MAG: excinuclease ABC subunit C [Candidatus Doudnabacteria bacterium RIFCSPHIGHO2_12_FULL_48_16]OGE96775.1 MAG: excinuclease ABC subunit C [Candidatus Doudnabacteria bacterium RIFCSPLOWO2_01_FULL_49_40]OGF02668.1 MAG: excinuclease ABC subunit C [Candidatus Doudnabacteria bacterium RIFCSPLOWO2_12_FULL_49_8]OGF03369.1 MAG: excinuclease ABC subunit C [Candidatus Doudnabacteria bacterium RI
MAANFAQKLTDLPKKPGVYIFKDQAGAVLYVGKAVNLRARVGSYFKQGAEAVRSRIQIMIAQIADLDYVVTDNETESLILENNFIKQLKPKYNVMLRDDKNYLFIKINLQDEIPTIDFEHRITDRKARHFGPYTSGLAIKDTLRLLRRIFPYCANAKIGSKPCFYYHIGKCPGVCFGQISVSDYRENYIKKIIKFLEGRQVEVLQDLQRQMKTAAGRRQFETAAKIRNQIFALNRVLERQKIVYAQKINQDVFSLYQDGAACVNLFIIREGKLIQKENFILDNAKQSSTAEILESFLPRYYLDASSKPKEILLPVKINEEEILSSLQATAKQSQNEIASSSRLIGTPRKDRIKIQTPTRGTKHELIKLGELNAKQYLEAASDKHLLEEARLMSSLRELQRILKLPQLPGRIEAYDISNIQGTNAVGSMVVFDFGRPKKDQYRKFKINKKQTPDDFAMMREMLERRFKKAWSAPDLILIDGGKGQLNAAITALKITNYKFQIPILGLAKRLEEIFLPGRKTPVILPPNSIGLFLLQRIRDEAHRFAVKYHRTLRSRKSLTSVLDSITGVGPNKKRRLLLQFGSAEKIRQASLTELAAIVGGSVAEKIKASL